MRKGYLVLLLTIGLLLPTVCLAEVPTSIAALATEFVGEEEAAVVETVCFEIGEEENIDPWLIACVWRYEAGFRKDPPGYYIGALQLDPDHLEHFKEYGFDPTWWKDWIRYGVHLWHLSSENELSLFEALEPWGVRCKAMRLYKKVRGDYDDWDSFKDAVTVD
jgi:hypothetical protein